MSTGLIGKWHLGVAEPLPSTPPRLRRVLRNAGRRLQLHRLPPSRHPLEWPAEGAPTTRTSESRVIRDGFEVIEVEEYLTDVFAEKAVDFIDRHADERFLLMLTPNTPHTPLQATDEYMERVQHIEGDGARVYAAMVVSLDDYVGDVVAALRRHDLERDTLVVFLSDNGCINYMSRADLHQRAAGGAQALSPRRRSSCSLHPQVAGGPSSGRGLPRASQRSRSLRHVRCRERSRREQPGQRQSASASTRRDQRAAARVPLLAGGAEHRHPLGQVEDVESEQHRLGGP